MLGAPLWRSRVRNRSRDGRHLSEQHAVNPSFFSFSGTTSRPSRTCERGGVPHFYKAKAPEDYRQAGASTSSGQSPELVRFWPSRVVREGDAAGVVAGRNGGLAQHPTGLCQISKTKPPWLDHAGRGCESPSRRGSAVIAGHLLNQRWQAARGMAAGRRRHPCAENYPGLARACTSDSKSLERTVCIRRKCLPKWRCASP